MSEEQKAPIPILGTETPGTESTLASGKGPLLRGPRNRGLVVIFSRLLNPALIIALTLPILWGLALAHWHNAAMNGWSIALLLIANGAFCLGLSLAGSYTDFRRALLGESVGLEDELLPDSPAKKKQVAGQDVFQLLIMGVVRPGTIRSLILLCLSTSLLAYLWLGALIGWPLLFFGVLSILLAIVPMLPIIRYSRWQWLLGDLAILVAVGFLPMLSAYYAQRESIDRWVLLASVAPAILAWLTFMSYNLLSWRRDWRLRRGSAVAVLGPARALDGAAVMGVAAFTSVLLLMAVGALPLSSLLVLGALPIFLRAHTRNNREKITHADAMYVVDRSTQAAILAGLLWMLALWNG